MTELYESLNVGEVHKCNAQI